MAIVSSDSAGARHASELVTRERGQKNQQRFSWQGPRLALRHPNLGRRNQACALDKRRVPLTQRIMLDDLTQRNACADSGLFRAKVNGF